MVCKVNAPGIVLCRTLNAAHVFGVPQFTRSKWKYCVLLYYLKQEVQQNISASKGSAITTASVHSMRLCFQGPLRSGILEYVWVACYCIIKSPPNPIGSRTLSPIEGRWDGHLKLQEYKSPDSSRSHSLFGGQRDAHLQLHQNKSPNQSHIHSLVPIGGWKDDHHYQQQRHTFHCSSRIHSR